MASNALDFDISDIQDMVRNARKGVNAATTASAVTGTGARAPVPTLPTAATGAVDYAGLDTPTILRQAQAAARGAATSIPIGENAAPLATSEAANASTIGQRVLAAAGEGGSVLGRFGRFLGAAASRLTVPLAALSTGIEAGRILTPDKLAVGAADMVGTVADKLGFKNSYSDGLQQYINAQGVPTPTRVAAAPAGGVPAAGGPADQFPTNQTMRVLSGDDAATVNSRYFNGTAVPADGTGYIRNESTGNVTALDSRGQPRTAVRVPQPAAATAALAQPTLGTEGGVFGNLAQFTNDFSRYALTNAQAGGSRKLANAEAETAIKRNDSASNRENQSQNAQSNSLKALADVLKETTNANKENVKTVIGLDGNPIIVDQKAGTAKKVVPSQKPPLDQFLTEARKDSRNKGFTDAQLKAYYTKTYGG